MTNVLDINGRLGEALGRLKGMLPPEVRRQWEADEAKERELVEMLRTNCVDALELIASAMRHPRISMPDLESAIAMLTVARDCAKALDR